VITDPLVDVVERQLEIATLSGDAESMMQAIVARVREATGADVAMLALLDGDELVLRVTTPAEGMPPVGARLPIAATLVGICVATGEPQLTDDLAADAAAGRAAASTFSAGSLAFTPLTWNGVVRGVLGAYSKHEHAFAATHVEMMQMMAHAAAVALRNAEAVAAIARREEHYRSLIHRAADAMLVLDHGAVILDANAAAERLFGHARDDLIGRSTASFMVPDLEREPYDLSLLLTEGRSTDTWPTRRGDGSIVELESSAAVVGDVIISALRDVTASRRTERTLREVVETQREISGLANDLDATMKVVAERCQRLVGADGAGVQWFEGDDFVYRFASGMAAPHLGVRLRLDASLSGLAAQTGELQYSSDTLDDPRVDRAACERIGMRSLICVPLRHDGRPVGVLAVMSQVPNAFDELALETTRLMAEFVSAASRTAADHAARRESEQLFRTAFESAGIGMTVSTLEGRYVEVNPMLCELLGYTREELMEMGYLEVTHPDDLTEDDDFVASLRSGNQRSYEREKRYLRKDGSILWGSLTVAIVFDDDGEPVHLVSQVQDVTARKENQNLFAAVFDRSVLPIVIAGDDRRLAGANAAACDLLGVTASEVDGLLLADVFPEEPLDVLWPRFRELGTLQGELTLQRPDGSRREIEFSATADVHPGRHLGVLRDLTAQRQLEQELRQAQKMEAVGRLAGGIAHDFNNLLTAISGYGEFLAAGIEDPKLLGHAEEIKKAAARAAALTSQLLSFSRQQVLQPRVLDLNSVVAEMDTMLRRLIGEDIELTTMLAHDVGAVRADPSRLEQVIVNLVVNARDAMPNGGALTVMTSNVETPKHGRCVVLSIGDSGVGMTDDERTKLFEPFFTTKVAGTGLGLATVHGIVEQSGGSIEVDSEPGFGSSFRIFLPRVDEPVEVSDPLPAEAAGGSETIVLVEDETVVRNLVAEILESAGYAVLQAGDGNSAVELVRRHPTAIDLLVTDVVMPGMSGPDAAQAITSLRPGLRVLYMSGYTDSAILHHGVLDPGTAFLQKPFSAADMIRKVRGLLDAA
jgi:two-component system cell cycle sensor histidine kinase/response regulator CckA